MNELRNGGKNTNTKETYKNKKLLERNLLKKIKDFFYFLFFFLF